MDLVACAAIDVLEAAYRVAEDVERKRTSINIYDLVKGVRDLRRFCPSLPPASRRENSLQQKIQIETPNQIIWEWRVELAFNRSPRGLDMAAACGVIAEAAEFCTTNVYSVTAEDVGNLVQAVRLFHTSVHSTWPQQGGKAYVVSFPSWRARESKSLLVSLPTGEDPVAWVAKTLDRKPDQYISIHPVKGGMHYYRGRILISSHPTPPEFFGRTLRVRPLDWEFEWRRTNPHIFEGQLGKPSWVS